MTGRKSRGVCGGGRNDGGGRSPSEQPVHDGVAVASGDAAGDRVAVPSGTAQVLDGAQPPPASARVLSLVASTT